MKLFSAILLSVICISTASAVTVKMYRFNKSSINEPIYIQSLRKSISNKQLYINAIAESDNFPYSSEKQGSVFYKIFEDVAENTGVNIILEYNADNYEEIIYNFEHDKKADYNARFGAYYKEYPYSSKQYIYPAYMINEIYIITSQQQKLNISNRKDLKNYKGIHPVTDKVSDVIEKSFKDLDIENVENFAVAFEQLLTGKADYIVASYYPSVIEAYKLGVKKYVAYSKEAVWKMPMFLRVEPSLLNHPRMENFVKYLKSSQYKKMRDDALEELIEIYKENSLGIISPTYIKTEQENDEDNSTEDNEQLSEN